MMRRLWFCAALALLAIPALAQVSNQAARRIVKHASDPATCRVGDVYYKTTATIGLYTCTATNTWAAAGGTFTGGAITTPISAANGTAGAPSYAFTNKLSQGLFLWGLSGGTETGTDTAATAYTVTGDLGTGTGAAGSIIFKAGTPQTTGTTTHPAVTILTLKDSGSAGTSKPQLLAGIGTAAVPIYSIAADPATGMNVLTNTVTLGIAGAAKLTVDGGTGFLLFDYPARIRSANGAYTEYGTASELLTLSTGGTTTDTAANLLPANSYIDAVTARITTTITTATNWKLGDATIAGRFTAANSTMTAGTTDVGLVHLDLTGTSGPRQTAAAKVRVTTTGTPGAGVIRITVHYHTFVPPTS